MPFIFLAMAALPLTDRQKIWRALMRYWSNQREGLPIVKGDFMAAVTAADAWPDSNAASYNSALPAAFRTNATNAQKALLLATVALARFLPDVIKQALGVEID